MNFFSKFTFGMLIGSLSLLVAGPMDSVRAQGSNTRNPTKVMGSGSRNSPPVTKQQKPLFAKVVKTEQQWRRQLSDLDYRVTREKGTENAFSGKYWNNKKDGVYFCKCCGLTLFDAKTKFKSGTGWPSYTGTIKNHVLNKEDRTAGMVRTEVICARCDAHLGHVFSDGPRPSGLRYCINSASLNFIGRKKYDLWLKKELEKKAAQAPSIRNTPRPSGK